MVGPMWPMILIDPCGRRSSASARNRDGRGMEWDQATVVPSLDQHGNLSEKAEKWRWRGRVCRASDLFYYGSPVVCSEVLQLPIDRLWDLRHRHPRECRLFRAEICRAKIGRPVQTDPDRVLVGHQGEHQIWTFSIGMYTLYITLQWVLIKCKTFSSIKCLKPASLYKHILGYIYRFPMTMKICHFIEINRWYI